MSPVTILYCVHHQALSKMEERDVIQSAGVYSAIFVRDSFMLQNSGNPESVNLGVNCKDEPAVTNIKTAGNDLCVSSDVLCDTGLQGNVYDTEIMPPELNITFMEAEYMEENTKSDNNPVQDPLLLTEKDFLDFAKRETLTIDFNLDNKNIIRDQINGIVSVHERRDSNSYICPVIKKENTETNSFEQLTSEGTQDALICASVKKESVASQRAGVGMEVERTDPDPSYEQLVFREDYSEESRVSSLRGEESRVDEDGGSSTEVMCVTSRRGKQTCLVKGVERKKGELSPGNYPNVSQAIKLRMCSPASQKKCSTKSMKKTNVNVIERESGLQTEQLLGRKNHIIGSSKFTTDGEPMMHRMTHTGDEPFKCSDCEYKCYNKRYYTEHIMTHTKRFQCTICDYKCSRKQHLKAHLLRHSGDKPFQCTFCDYKCCLKQSLKTHLMTHSGDKPFQCTICDYKSSQKRNLKAHLMTHSGDKPFLCTICDFKCSLKQYLKKHLLTHSGDKPFQCTICDFKFSQKHDLKTHLMTHSGDKPFQCTICDYKSSLKRNLKAHLMTHSGDKPFQCSICDFKCSLKQTLKSHLMSHSGDKPFQCTICDFKCSRKHNLKTHLMTHSGDKPFQCTICDYKCVMKRNLETHLMSHSGDKPFQCTICDYKSTYKQHLKRHSKTHTLHKSF